MADRVPATFADACEAVLSAPDGDHSVDTTLAPIAARTLPEGWGRRRERAVTAHFSGDVTRVLELGCGVGVLLRRLAERYDVVGVDDRRARLEFAAIRGGAVIQGRPAAPPVRGRFDGVCAAEYATARAPVGDLCVAAYAALRPGGLTTVVAPRDAAAVAEPGVETYAGSTYRLERAVDVADGIVTVDYRVTDRGSGDASVTRERRRIETTTAEGVAAALRTAGFEAVSASEVGGPSGVVVGRGTRPVRTGG